MSVADVEVPVRTRETHQPKGSAMTAAGAGVDTHTGQPVPGRGLRLIAFPAAVYAFAVVMMGTTLPTPLYPEYQREFGFGSLMTTVIFATYAVGVIAALIGVGQFSDTIGRRPMLFAGVALSLVSAVLFLIGGSVEILFVGRLVSGFSAGIFTSTATVAVIEAAPAARRRMAPAIATAANIGGLGLGPLVAGVVTEFAPYPTRTVFVVHALVDQTGNRLEGGGLSRTTGSEDDEELAVRDVEGQVFDADRLAVVLAEVVEPESAHAFTAPNERPRTR